MNLLCLCILQRISNNRHGESNVDVFLLSGYYHRNKRNDIEHNPEYFVQADEAVNHNIERVSGNPEQLAVYRVHPPLGADQHQR